MAIKAKATGRQGVRNSLATYRVGRAERAFSGAARQNFPNGTAEYSRHPAAGRWEEGTGLAGGVEMPGSSRNQYTANSVNVIRNTLKHDTEPI